MDNDFDLFDFAAQNAQAPEIDVSPALTAPRGDALREIPVAAEAVPAAEPGDATPKKKSLSRAEQRQAAFAFLMSRRPDAAAENVPTRRAKYRVAAAGFWRSGTQRSKNIVMRTAVVVLYDDLDCCYADCAGREARMAVIAGLQKEKHELEARIRRDEPHLAAADDLFAEFRTWDYAASSNHEYHKLRRRLENELHTLSQGSKIEQIRRAGVADFCYLAVPEGMIDPELLPPTWGLVELSPGKKRFSLRCEAAPQDNTTPAARLQLAINIAVSAGFAARFAAGVDADGRLRRPPRRRPTL